MDTEEGTPFPTQKVGGGWRRALERRVPLLAWAPRYSRLAAAADLVAGVTLGLTLVPQSIAYAALAGLPVHYGLYSSFMGTMLYMVFGTVKEVSIGPTSLMALLVLQACHGLPVQYVTLLAFLSGAVVLLMGLLRLGFLVDLISPPVTSGFTSGTAVIIVVTQLKGLLGLSFTAESIPDNLALIARQWDRVQLPDVLLSLVCCTLLLLLRVGPKRAALQRALWLVSISRNALVVAGAAFFAYHACDHDKPFIKLSGHVTPGLPPLSLPAFSLQGADNSTVSFTEMVHELGSAVIMMPIVMVLANIAIAKAFTSGGRVDATQEMLTLGVCNMAGALVHAMPTCGAFTRSAVSHSSGVQTPAAGLYSGIIVLLALRFMTHYFKFIPKACLSSVLICAVIFMIDLGTVRRLWRTSRAELAVLLLTFMVCLADSVERAVLVGVLAATAVLLRAVMRPAVHRHHLQVGGTEATRVRPTLALIFLNVEHVSAKLVAAARARPHAPLLLDCSALSLIDDASRQALERLVKKFKSADQKLIVYNASPEVLKSLEAVEGLDKRALGAATALEALTAIVDTSDHIVETTALLEKKETLSENFVSNNNCDGP
ncbi:sodium-independent sulfate anion transporter-like isoform X2 [Choristoneura fumiferana]|uniref:sodium-independent sulfate anion transporter-like isoform X2 n=1 Tax=Choristoneura fumiferana TaxID=7141 RepID=UPI003D15E17D